MERPPSPTTKPFRPLLRRAATASPETSPPVTRTHDHLDARFPRVAAIPSHAARKLHLHTRGHSKDDPRLPRDAAGKSGTSTARARPDDDAAAAAAAAGTPYDMPRPTATSASVLAERKRRARRTDELTASLRALTARASGMSAQLDATYAALRAKAATLRAMVAQLAQLDRDATALQRGFAREVHDLQGRVESDVAGFGAFGGEKGTIESLEVRMRVGMARAERLSVRLGRARGRVGRWAVREREWQDGVSARLRTSAITVGLAVGVVVLLLVIRLTWLNRDARQGILTNSSPHDDANLWDLRHSFALPVRSPGVSGRTQHVQSLGDDKRLHLLDEL